MSTASIEAAIVSQPIDPQRVLDAVADVSTGATALFVGTVRNVHDGRPVTGIEYHAYAAMAERELRSIAEETVSQFGVRGIAILHRVGYLALGETSVAIAASHPRRAAAFDAARHLIEEIKRRVPIWKREHYEDGTREWVDPTGEAAGPEPLRPAHLVSGVG